MDTVAAEVRFKGDKNEGDISDTSHVYNPLWDAKSGSSCTVTDATVMFPIWLLLTRPPISVPLGLNHEISGVAKSVIGFVTVQVMEYMLPAVLAPSVDVDTDTAETGTVKFT